MTTSDSSSTPPTPGGGTTSAILSLGLLIADALDEQDLLGRWMAHYLAERLHALEGLEGEARSTAEDQIAALVVQLWKQREHVRFRVDPTPQLDAVERALERLDPDRGAWAFHRPFTAGSAPAREEMDVDGVLDLALRVDRLSGDVVRDLIGFAATTALDTEAGWVRAARDAQISTSPRSLERLLEAYGEHDSRPRPSRGKVRSSAERLIDVTREATLILASHAEDE